MKKGIGAAVLTSPAVLQGVLHPVLRLMSLKFVFSLYSVRQRACVS